MQFPAERPEFFDQRFFDEVVHVFGVGAECLEPPGIRFRSRCNFVERSQRLPHLRGRENADRFKSPGPGAVHGNFVRQETTIKGKRALERVELFVRCALEASAPQSVVFAFGHEKVFSP